MDADAYGLVGDKTAREIISAVESGKSVWFYDNSSAARMQLLSIGVSGPSYYFHVFADQYSGYQYTSLDIDSYPTYGSGAVGN